MTTIYNNDSIKLVEFDINELFEVLRRNVLDDIITGKTVHCGYFMENPFYDNINNISNKVGQDIGFDNMERIITTYHINEFYALCAKYPVLCSYSYYSGKLRVNKNNLISSDIIIFNDEYDENNLIPKPAIIYDKREGLNKEDIINTIYDLSEYIDNEKVIYVNKYFNYEYNKEYDEEDNEEFNTHNIYVMCIKDDDVETAISNKECSYIGFIGADDIDISYLETFDRVIKLFVDKIENEEEVIKENAQKLGEKETEQKLNDISNKISDVVSDEKRILPFSIINNKEKGRVNIKFDTTEINRDILKELKAHGWKFASSTKQWYPVGNAVNTALDFANKLQEKYTEIKIPNVEKPMDLGPEKSPYDGIRFFDRNYNESEEFAKFFNSNIHLFKKGKESAITEEQASTILKAIGYENVGIVEQRRLRIGLDKNDKIVILSSINGKVETQKLEFSEVLGFAKEKAAEQVVEAKEILEAYVGKSSTMKKDFQDIFIRMYETCIEQAESINKRMQDVYNSFMPKEKEVSKEAILYQRISYRGWEISSDKDFKKSYYVRPFEQTDRSGYILMAGKEGKDGFWQEKFVREMLKSNNWSEREALIETLTRLASDKETCISLGIKEPQSLNGFFSSLDKIIHVENDTDIKNELMESLLGSSESYKVSKENIKELSVGDKLGKDSVSDLYKISEGVYQATLSREVNGVGSAQNYFVIDNSIINQLNEELKELVVSFDSKSVIENKNYEPYILKELIEKGLMPPRDDDFIQQLDEYISVHPLKYEKLKPVDYLNFERKLQEIAEVDKEFNKTPFELGQQLIALVGENDREKLNNWLKKQGCDSKEHMAKVFASWINKEQKKDIMQKKDNGYPPRGEN